MMKYEQDFIYKIIPDLTVAINGLTEEIRRYNDNKEEEKCQKDEKPSSSQQ